MPQAVPRTEPERGLQPIMPGVSGAVDAEISGRPRRGGREGRRLRGPPQAENPGQSRFSCFFMIYPDRR